LFLPVCSIVLITPMCPGCWFNWFSRIFIGLSRCPFINKCLKNKNSFRVGAHGQSCGLLWQKSWYWFRTQWQFGSGLNWP
jgi:hypothetical protein